MKIHKGDNIIVLSGAYRGKTGRVVKALPDRGLVVVPGVNLKKKHQKARRANQKGQLIEVALPFSVSKAALIDPSLGKATRVGRKLVGEKWVRVSKKSGKEI